LRLIFFFLAFSTLLSFSNAATTLHVAPDAGLTNLKSARDAVRQLRNNGNAETITVEFASGVYRFTQPVVFGLADSAPADAKTIYLAAKGAKVFFSGGVPVTQWQPLSQRQDQAAKRLASRVPADVQAKIFVADVKQFGNFYTLFDRAKRLPRASCAGFSQTNRTPRGDTRSGIHTALVYPEKLSGRYDVLGKLSAKEIAEGELRVIPSYPWIMNILPLASLDATARTIRTSQKGTYPLGANWLSPHRATAWLENLPEFLDQPGEWCLDVRSGLLLLFPQNDTPSQGIVVPCTNELIRVEGETDYDGPTDKPVTGLVFEGLTLMHADRVPWQGRTGRGLQHDWEMFDRSTALLRFRGAERCVVRNCEFLASGHTGIRLDLHSQGIEVVGNHLHHLGGTGILLAGYGPGTKNVNHNNTIKNNLLHHLGQEYAGSGGIFAWQSGENEITNNTLHHLPYTAILATGRIHRGKDPTAECVQTRREKELPATYSQMGWKSRQQFLHSRNNLIARNEIHHVMEKLGDGNCIYVSGAGGGNKVVENYLHDCPGGGFINAMIRCDDDQHQTLIARNACLRGGGHAEGIISKGDNDIIGNLIADLRPAGPQKIHHRGYIIFPYGNITGARVEKNILLPTVPEIVPYFCGRNKRHSALPVLTDLEVLDKNILYNTSDPNWGKKWLAKLRKKGLASKSLAIDPQLRNVKTGNFFFPQGSAAATIGFVPLDVRKVGASQSTTNCSD